MLQNLPWLLPGVRGGPPGPVAPRSLCAGGARLQGSSAEPSPHADPADPWPAGGPAEPRGFPISGADQGRPVPCPLPPAPKRPRDRANDLMGARRTAAFWRRAGHAGASGGPPMRPLGKCWSPGREGRLLCSVFSPRRARLLPSLCSCSVQGRWAAWVLGLPSSPHPCPRPPQEGLATGVSVAQLLCCGHDPGQPGRSVSTGAERTRRTSAGLSVAPAARALGSGHPLGGQVRPLPHPGSAPSPRQREAEEALREGLACAGSFHPPEVRGQGEPSLSLRPCPGSVGLGLGSVCDLEPGRRAAGAPWWPHGAGRPGEAQDSLSPGGR